MTDVLSRPAPAPATRDRALRPVVAAVAAALLAALEGLVLCVGVAFAGWVGTSRGSLHDVVRAGADAWLLGHGSGLDAGGAAITVLPVGLLLVFAALLWRAGRWAARSSALDGWRSVSATAATVAGCYSAIGVLVAVLAGTDEVAVSPVRASAATMSVALIFAGGGLATAAGVVAPTLARWPEELRAALRGGTAVLVVLFGTGALLVTASLVAAFGPAATAADSLRAGVVGGSVFTAVQVLLLPNAALLAMAYLIGPGFVLGAGSLVAPGGTTVGAVPAVPLLAALPGEGPAPWWAMTLVATPVLAGAVGAMVALREFPVFSLEHGALRGGLAGLLGGAAAGLLTALGGGAIGPGRMSDIGALVWQCTLAAAVAAGVGGAAAAVVLVWWTTRRRRAG